MKICYISDTKYSHTEKWVKYFIDKGHEVHVITGTNQDIEGATIHYIKDINMFSKKKLPKTLINIFKVKNLIKKINPDIVHGHQLNSGGIYVSLLGKNKGIVSAWGSDVLIYPEKNILNKYIIKYVLKNLLYVTSDSIYMSKKIIELGCEKSKILTFPMGIHKSILNYRHDYKEENKEINILSMRLHYPNYNISEIIKGFAKVYKLNKNIFLNIAADGIETKELKKLVSELDILNNVKFIGRYRNEDVGEILKNQDIVISVPSSDATSVSLLESLAVGVFPIVSNIPANREWIEDKVNGLLVDPKADSIAEAILWCIKSFKFIGEVSAKNIELVREKAIWEDNIKLMEEKYSDLYRMKG